MNNYAPIGKNGNAGISVTSICVGIMTVVMFGFLSSSCKERNGAGKNEYLLRVGMSEISVGDFKNAYEAAKIGYPYETVKPSQGKDGKKVSKENIHLRMLKLRLLKQLTEKLIMRERARELGIDVTEAELEKEINRIRADYPNDEFEKMLIEYAVPFALWKSRLADRLLMKKIITHEFRNQIAVTQEEIAEYYHKHYEKKARVEDSEKNDSETVTRTMDQKDLDKMIVGQIRRQKLENAYQLYIEALRKRFRISINQEKWKKILGSAEKPKGTAGSGKHSE